MDTPLISVIIPVYNVEPYLERCLESVIVQSYTNLEIIVVDDGSTDRSGAICAEFAAREPRIKLLRQTNAGVAAARNAGLAHANGEWIGWIDADDWVEPKMFELMLHSALDSGADIAVCSRYEDYRDHRRRFGWEQTEFLNTEDALTALLENGSMKNFLWDKLWKKKLFDGLTFPVGRTYEDVALMHRLFERASAVICIPDVLYHYNQRPGSIVGDVSLASRIDYYRAAKQRCEEMLPRWSCFQSMLNAQCAASTIGIWSGYYANPKHIRRQYDRELKNIAAFSRLHRRDAKENLHLGMAGRMVLAVTPYAQRWAFFFARIFGWLYQKRHGRPL